MLNLLFNLWYYFSSIQKKNFYFIGILSIIYIALETLSISILLPFFSVILGQEIRHFSFIEELKEFFGFQDLLLFLVITVAFTFTIKNFLLIFFYFLLNKYISLFQTETSKKLLSANLYKNYVDLMNYNSSKLIRNISISSQNLASFVKDIIIFVLNIIIIFFLLVLLLISSKFSIIFILILSTISLLIIFISRKYIYSLGKQFLNFSELWMLKLKDSSKAIKQIKLMNLENYFLNDFVKNNKEFNFTNALKNTITLAPRFIIEIFVILVLCTLIYISSTNETINQNDLLLI